MHGILCVLFGSVFLKLVDTWAVRIKNVKLMLSRGSFSVASYAIVANPRPLLCPADLPCVSQTFLVSCISCESLAFLLPLMKVTHFYRFQSATPSSSPESYLFLSFLTHFLQNFDNIVLFSLNPRSPGGGGGSNWPPLDFFGFKFLLLDRLPKALVQLFLVCEHIFWH